MPWTIDIVEVGVIPGLPLAIYFPDEPPSTLVDIPCYAYLLTGGGAPIVVDTGPDPATSARAGFTVHGHARKALVGALARRGLTPDDVPLVVQSHLHYDHMQNMGMFRNARVLVQRSEVEWTRSPEPGPFYVEVDRFVQDLGSRLEPIEGDTRVTEGIDVLLNRGHSPGHQSVLVQTGQGIACLAIDIIPMAANVDIVPPSVDDAGTRAFLERVRSESWEIVPGHDPALRADARYVSGHQHAPDG